MKTQTLNRNSYRSPEVKKKILNAYLNNYFKIYSQKFEVFDIEFPFVGMQRMDDLSFRIKFLSSEKREWQNVLVVPVEVQVLFIDFQDKTVSCFLPADDFFEIAMKYELDDYEESLQKFYDGIADEGANQKI